MELLTLQTKDIMTENIKKVKAEITSVKLGIVELEGLLSEKGDFGIAVPQICSLFNIDQNQATRNLKRLLDNSLNIDRWVTPFRKNYTNVVNLSDFERILAKLDRKGNKLAQDIRDTLAGLSLHQLFCDAFQIKFEVDERLSWIQERAIGKAVRRTLTDAIKDYLETTETTEEYRKWVYANATELVNLGVFRRRANQLRKDWGCKNPRDKMTSDELRWVLQVEELAMRLIDRDKIEPLNAVREAVSRLCIEVVRR